MPSLRRTISFPSVRAVPYRTLSSSASSSGPPEPTNPHGHRRSSGSDVGARRVLADIEWWRVVDGQRDFDVVDSELEDRNRHQNLVQLTSQVLAIENPGVVRTELPVEPSLGNGGGRALEVLHVPPTNAFAALSISPYSPILSRQTSVSSLSSSVDGFASPSLDGFPCDDFHWPQPQFPEFPISNGELGDESGIIPMIALRSHYFSDFVAFKTAPKVLGDLTDRNIFPTPIVPFLCD